MAIANQPTETHSQSVFHMFYSIAITDLEDSCDEEPVPVKVLFVVEDLTVPQVQHQCFLCVLQHTHTQFASLKGFGALGGKLTLMAETCV